MILITRIDWKEVEGDCAHIRKMPPIELVPYDSTDQSDFMEAREVQDILVTGQYFAYLDDFGFRREVCIGTEPEAAKMLGIQIENLHKLTTTVDELRNHNSYLTKRNSYLLDRIEDMNAHYDSLWSTKIKRFFRFLITC